MLCSEQSAVLAGVADGDQQRGISRSLEIHLAAQVAAARTSHHHNKYCHHQLSKLSVRKKYCSCKLKCMVISRKVVVDLILHYDRSEYLLST